MPKYELTQLMGLGMVGGGVIYALGRFTDCYAVALEGANLLMTSGILAVICFAVETWIQSQPD